MYSKKRYKDRKIKEVVEIIENLSNESVEIIINELLMLLNKGKYKYDIYDYEDIINSKTIPHCPRCVPIIDLLKQKFNSEKILN